MRGALAHYSQEQIQRDDALVKEKYQDMGISKNMWFTYRSQIDEMQELCGT